MKRMRLLILTLALLSLCACGKKEETAADVPQAVSGGSGEEVHKAEDSRDSAWAAKLAPAPKENGVLRRETKYGSDGSVLSWIDYSCNADGRVIKSTPHEADGSSAEGDVVSTFEYTNGYLTAKTDYDALSGRILYRYKYDAAGNEIKWILYGEDGSVSMWYEDAYDEHGNMVSHQLYRPGEEVKVMNLREYDYDEHGHPTECRYVNTKGTVLNRYTFRNVYDAAGRLIECEQNDVGGSVLVDWYRYRYNDAGQLIEQQLLDAGERCLIRTEYIYDGAGRLARQQIYSSDGALAVILENLWE